MKFLQRRGGKWSSAKVFWVMLSFIRSISEQCNHPKLKTSLIALANRSSIEDGG